MDYIVEIKDNIFNLVIYMWKSWNKFKKLMVFYISFAIFSVAIMVFYFKNSSVSVSISGVVVDFGFDIRGGGGFQFQIFH